MDRRILRLAALGGVAGAGGRWLLGVVVASDGVPWALVLANALGCALLGAVIVVGDAERRALLGLGLAGGLTSMSALALAVAHDLDAGDPAGAAALLVGALASGLVAYLLGEALARRLDGADGAAS